MRTAALVLASVMLLLGCPPQGTAPSTPPSSPPSSGYQPPPSSDQTPPPPAAGESCLTGSDCASGICEGQGCDDAHPGTCAPADRMCTRDARAYCGCDGQTFTGSGSCAGKRYASAGACPAP